MTKVSDDDLGALEVLLTPDSPDPDGEPEPTPKPNVMTPEESREFYKRAIAESYARSREIERRQRTAAWIKAGMDALANPQPDSEPLPDPEPPAAEPEPEAEPETPSNVVPFSVSHRWPDWANDRPRGISDWR